MPCSDSSSSIALNFDSDETFISFEYAKITCGREISGGTGLSAHLMGKPLNAILEMPFAQLCADLKHSDEETQFILYSEWAALRSAIAQFLGLENEEYDKDRCQITAIEHSEEGTDVALVILPPKELPKILPCSLGDKHNA